MSDDALKLLLVNADRDGVDPAPASAGDLLAAALRRRRSQARRRTAAVAAVLAVAAATLLKSAPRDPAEAVVERNPSIATPRKTADELRAELARLEREAAIQVQVVRGLVETEQAAVEDPKFASSTDDAELVRREAARSAAISWQYATLVEQELNDLAAARREYERVARRFPGTRWAELAAVSLRRLSTAEEPSL
jgi:hypothetical protein